MTPQLYGLITATPGLVESVTVPAATGEIVVRNDSAYDVWVKIGPNQPQAPSPLTFAQYSVQVTPGQRAIRTPVPFDGRLWLGVYNPGGKAASGTISSRANVYVEAYPLGESAGAGASYSALTGLDSTSQQRVISIPTEPHMSGTIGLSLNAFVVPVYTGFQIGVGPFNGTQLVTVYFYGFVLHLQQGRFADFVLSVVDLTASNTILAVHALGTFRVVSEPNAFFPPSPIGLQFAPTAGAVSIGFGVEVTAQWPSIGQPPVLIGTIECDVDLTGQTPPPAIGNGAATPPGAIY